jgi:hypothetical protein
VGGGGFGGGGFWGGGGLGGGGFGGGGVWGGGGLWGGGFSGVAVLVGWRVSGGGVRECRGLYPPLSRAAAGWRRVVGEGRWLGVGLSSHVRRGAVRVGCLVAVWQGARVRHHVQERAPSLPSVETNVEQPVAVRHWAAHASSSAVHSMEVRESLCLVCTMRGWGGGAADGGRVGGGGGWGSKRRVLFWGV